MGQQLKTTKMGAKQIEKAQRAAAACELRCQGLTLAQIAAELGCDPTTARDLITYAIGLVPKENASELIRLTEGRYDRLRRGLLAIAEGEKTTSTERQAAYANLIRLEERQAKFSGIDAPAKVQLSSHTEGRGGLIEGFDPLNCEEWEAVVVMRRAGEKIPARLEQWLLSHPTEMAKVENELKRLAGAPKNAEILTASEIVADSRAEAAREVREVGGSA